MIDQAHFDMMTGGDRALQAEVLEMFEQQCALWRRLLVADAPALMRGDAAHGLKGSARGIGLWRLAERCEIVERLSRGGEVQRALLRRELAELIQALDDALAAIGDWRAAVAVEVA